MPSVTSILTEMFGRTTRAKTPYTPRYCRTRGCNQPYGHEERHTGKHRQGLLRSVPRAVRPHAGKFFGQDWAPSGIYGTNHDRLHHRRRPRTTSVASQQRMAEYRRGPRIALHTGPLR